MRAARNFIEHRRRPCWPPGDYGHRPRNCEAPYHRPATVRLDGQSRHLVDGVGDGSIRLRCPDVADVFAGRETVRGPASAGEVVGPRDGRCSVPSASQIMSKRMDSVPVSGPRCERTAVFGENGVDPTGHSLGHAVFLSAVATRRATANLVRLALRCLRLGDPDVKEPDGIALERLAPSSGRRGTPWR